ncbi:MAG TPA: FxSxx-COOH system tetratricopeptide repeat protein [Acidimicrobiales bacterium]|nr:FxSxx-COOH system tetratricopeptide repeat protein [Acidimicrobiales bacterium]
MAVERQVSGSVDARDAQGVQVVAPGGTGVQNNYFRGRRAAAWPHRVGVPPPRADGFQDRTVAEVLDDAAGAGRTTVVTQVVSGMGGVGKTQLAAAFARRMWDEQQVDLLAWVPAGTRQSVVSTYARAGGDLVLGPEGDAPEDAAARFLAWLASTDRRWLVVLDDLAAADDVRGLWPPDHPTGRTVVTTRRRDAGLLGDSRELVEVGVFTEDEAVAYLTGKLPPGLADDTGGVAADLGRLPLALGHAAAYMVDQDLRCSAYRRRLADERRRLTELFPGEHDLFDGSTGTVATTWGVSIEAADRAVPVGLARPVLELAGLLDPNGIPEAVLAAGSGDDEDDVHDALRALHRFNLVTHDAALVRVHALVQRAVREGLPDARLDALACTAADALMEMWPAVDRADDDSRLLCTNALTLHRRRSAALWDPDAGAHPVLRRTARSLGDAALLADAIRFSRELRGEAVERLGTEHRDTLAIGNELAVWLGDAGELTEAIALLEELVEESTRLLGPDHVDTLEARRALGYTRGMDGEPAAAVRELRAVHADRARVVGPEDPDTLTVADQIGYWLGKAGDAAGAVAQVEALLEVIGRVLDPDDRIALQARGNLAFQVGAAGDPEAAIAALEAVLADVVRVLGAEHRDVSVLRNNLAYWRGKAGDLVGARAAMEELLVERQRIYGPTHRDTLATRSALARLHAELGDRAAAMAELEWLVAHHRRIDGDDHSHTLRRRWHLAEAHGLLGDVDVAVAQLDDLMADVLRALGPDHVTTVEVREQLALWRAQSAMAP